MAPKNTIILLFILCATTLFAHAQTMFKISGIVTGEKGNPIERATITIKHLVPEQKAVEIFSDISGKFSLFLTPGQYSFSISHIGLKSKVIEKAIGNDTQLVFMLIDSISSLPDLVVKTEDQLTQQKADRLIYNISNDILANGLNAWEALRRVPMVRVDFNSRVTVNGLGASIMIDDKLLRLSEPELESFLQGLQASNIVKIEVIPIPPSKYDAQGGSLINIVTRKIYESGLKGNYRLGYTQAQFAKLNAGGDLFYRKTNLFISASLNFRWSKSYASQYDYINYQDVLTGNNYSNWYINSIRNRKTFLPSCRTDLYYDINKNTTLNFSIFTSLNKNLGGTRIANTMVYSNNLLDSTIESLNQSHGLEKNTAINLEIVKKLDSLGKSISFDLDFVKFVTKPEQTLKSQTFDNNSITISNFANFQESVQDVQIRSAKFDFNLPLPKSLSVESGAKFVSIRTENAIASYNIVNQASVNDDSRSNQFRYTENVYAGYVSFNKDLKSVTVKAGMRVEYSTTKGVSATTGTAINNNYLNLFPSLFLNYKLNKKINLNVSYSRRIERPGFWRLNPFEYFFTPYSSSKGNPFLQPAYPQQLQISTLYLRKYSFSIFYYNTNNFFTNIPFQDNGGKTIQDIQVNLGYSRSYGANLLIPLQIVKQYWTADCLLQGQIQKEAADYLGNSFSYSNKNFYGSITNRFLVAKKANIRAEISAWYSSKGIQGIYRIKPQGDVSATVRIPLFQNNATLSFVFSDIFYSQRYTIDIRYLKQNSGFEEQRDTRYVGINLTCKFGVKKTYRQVNKRDSGVEDETKRLK